MVFFVYFSIAKCDQRVAYNYVFKKKDLGYTMTGISMEYLVDQTGHGQERWGLLPD